MRRWKTKRHVQCHFGFTPGETAAAAPLLPSKRAGDCAARPFVHLATRLRWVSNVQHPSVVDDRHDREQRVRSEQAAEEQRSDGRVAQVVGHTLRRLGGAHAHEVGGRQPPQLPPKGDRHVERAVEGARRREVAHALRVAALRLRRQRGARRRIPYLGGALPPLASRENLAARPDGPRRAHARAAAADVPRAAPYRSIEGDVAAALGVEQRARAARVALGVNLARGAARRRQPRRQRHLRHVVGVVVAVGGGCAGRVCQGGDGGSELQEGLVVLQEEPAEDASPPPAAINARCGDGLSSQGASANGSSSCSEAAPNVAPKLTLSTTPPAARAAASVAASSRAARPAARRRSLHARRERTRRGDGGHRRRRRHPHAGAEPAEASDADARVRSPAGATAIDGAATARGAAARRPAADATSAPAAYGAAVSA